MIRNAFIFKASESFFDSRRFVFYKKNDFFTGFAESLPYIVGFSEFRLERILNKILKVAMGISASDCKVIPLMLDNSLYSLLENQAQLAGESLEKFIMDRLNDSIDAWKDYCSAVALLNNDEREHFQFCRLTDND